MPNEKTSVDQWVRREIENLNVPYTEQTSDITEIKNALKNASKQGGNGLGKPEFVFLINDTVIVVEDKPNTSQLQFLNETGEIYLTEPIVTANYAANGAVHYAMHIAEKTVNFKDIIAIGATGSSDNRSVVAYHVQNDNKHTTIKNLGPFNDWKVLSPINFDEWYGVNILGNLSKEQKDELELKKIAANLHVDLRNLASLEGENKATVISAILLALDSQNLSLEELKGHKKPTDGARIYRSIKDYMEDKAILPEEKRNIVLNKFRFIQTNVALNEKRNDLGMTPIRYFASILQNDVLAHFKNNTEFDILGNFYGEFVKYGDSDGNGLGIVLTPKHITSLMAELIQIGRNDYVLDPTAGSGAFLISAMNRMLNEELIEGALNTDNHIKQNQLFGIEMQEKMYTVATTNMILRGDGKSNLMLANMFTKNADNFIINGNRINITKVLMNPPYSQGSKANPGLYEINFIKHALEMTSRNGKLAVIVPQSTMTGKSKVEKEIKRAILENHTLESVITLNNNTFHGQRAGVQPVIAIFTAKNPHPEQKQVKFINAKDDGWIVKKHLGLVDDGSALSKRKILIDTILYDLPAENSFMVKSSIKAEDEWLHSYFYFNDTIPTMEDFEKNVRNYFSFKFNQTIHGREYLFSKETVSKKNADPNLCKINEITWAEFKISEVFEIFNGVRLTSTDMTFGTIPFIGSTDSNNGITQWTNITNSSTDSNLLGVNYNGSVGEVFYHPYSATFSDDVKRLKVKHVDNKATRELYLFLRLMVLHQKNKYAYGYKFNSTRMKSQKIMLPITVEGIPDWSYMEQFIVNIERNIFDNLNMNTMFFS